MNMFEKVVCISDSDRGFMLKMMKESEVYFDELNKEWGTQEECEEKFVKMLRVEKEELREVYEKGLKDFKEMILLYDEEKKWFMGDDGEYEVLWGFVCEVNADEFDYELYELDEIYEFVYE